MGPNTALNRLFSDWQQPIVSASPSVTSYCWAYQHMVRSKLQVWDWELFDPFLAKVSTSSLFSHFVTKDPEYVWTHCKWKCGSWFILRCFFNCHISVTPVRWDGNYNWQMERIWKEAVMACFEALSQHLSEISDLIWYIPSYAISSASWFSILYFLFLFCLSCQKM